MYWWEQQKPPEFLSVGVWILFFHSLVQSQARCAPTVEIRIKITFIELCFLRD